MELGAVVERLNTDTQLYHSLERIDRSQLDEVSVRHADSLLHDFEISGIHLDEGKRKEVVRLNQMILSLSHTFMYQCNEPYCIELNGAPQMIKDNLNLFHHDKDHVYITNAVHTHQDESLRKHTYSCYHSFNHPNGDTLDQLLTARYQLAALSGYETFAHRALQDTMAGSPQKVMEFLDKLNELITPLAKDEVKEMSLIKGGQVYPWDYTWMFHKVKSTLINSSDARELLKYFSIESCINGLCKLFQELFGVKMVVSQTLPGETWDDSITKFSFLQREAILGHLYVDWYDRTNKTASDCQFTIQGGRQMLLNNNDVSYQLPISALSLSLGYDHHLPSQSVYNLFHEMGHAIHSMLGRSPYQNTSGTRCPTDYAETPSNLMELFLQDTRVLKSFARHSKSNQPISTKLARLFSWSSNLYPAFTAQQQILYSVMDQVFHGPHPLSHLTRY
jgi:intermediate peptidase